MKDRVILHCDLNNFFASVSLLSSPTLYGMPVAVCGSEKERHGIVLAKNEIAKKYGVKTAEAVWEAKSKCPELVILSPDYKKYSEYSRRAREVYERYTDLVEPFGIDECWLDVTGSTLLFGTGEKIAERIRRDIKRELGITVSVGVSFTKIFAKLGSDMKKPDAVTVISRENYVNRVLPLPAEEMLFVGKNTAEKLNESGIFTIGDLARCDESFLKRKFGKSGVQLKHYAMGEDDSPVTPPSDDDMPKSIGRSITPDHDITTRDEVWKIFLELAEDICSSLRKKGLYAGGVQVHTRTVSLKVKEVSKSLELPLNTAITLARKGMDIFDGFYKWDMPLRSVGIRAVNLKKDGVAAQQDVFGVFDSEEREEKIADYVQSVRDRFGNKSIKRGRVIEKTGDR